jgi:hypothetical protein
VDSMTIRDIMSPTDDFPRISDQATFYEAVLALEDAQEAFLAGRGRQRILLVEDAAGAVVGKLSPMDVLRGLEPNYEKIDDHDIVSRFGLAYVAESMKEEYRLWQKPLSDLCRRATSLKVNGFLNTPTPDHTVDVHDSMDNALHLFVMSRHDSLFVKENGRILGLLRFSDVYRAVCQTMKACRPQ